MSGRLEDRRPPPVRHLARMAKAKRMEMEFTRELSESEPLVSQNTPTPDEARQELRDAARETLNVLQADMPMDLLTKRILTNQIYMLNVLRWLVARETERIRRSSEKESHAPSE